MKPGDQAFADNANGKFRRVAQEATAFQTDVDAIMASFKNLETVAGGVQPEAKVLMTDVRSKLEGLKTKADALVAHAPEAMAAPGSGPSLLHPLAPSESLTQPAGVRTPSSDPTPNANREPSTARDPVAHGADINAGRDIAANPAEDQPRSKRARSITPKASKKSAKSKGRGRSVSRKSVHA